MKKIRFQAAKGDYWQNYIGEIGVWIDVSIFKYIHLRIKGYKVRIIRGYPCKNFGLNEGDEVELIYARCIHKGEKNAYIGFKGIVKIDNVKEGKFSLFSGSAWLVNLDINTCYFRVINRNVNGIFKINEVSYYSKESVIHKPIKCCDCGFIPVEYSYSGLFKTKVYCSNCFKL